MGPRGGHPWPGASLVRPGGLPRDLFAWARGAPLRPPFGIYLALVPKIYRDPPVMRLHLFVRRRGDSALGIARRTCPDWLLIRPKRIYNFCLFRAYFGDLAICFDAFSYLLQYI